MDEHTYVLPKSSTYYLTEYTTVSFLNQARAGHRPARAWFLEIDPVRERLYVCLRVCVCVCVCVRPRGY